MGMGGNGNGNGFMRMGGNGNRNSPSRTPLLESDPLWHVQPVQFVVQECRQTTVKLLRRFAVRTCHKIKQNKAKLQESNLFYCIAVCVNVCDKKYNFCAGL